VVLFTINIFKADPDLVLNPLEFVSTPAHLWIAGLVKLAINAYE
jgi:hypothetical protein